MNTCVYCGAACRKNGFQRNGAQKLKCVSKSCGKNQQQAYKSMTRVKGFHEELLWHITHGTGTRDTAAKLGVSPATIVRFTRKMADAIIKPPVPMGKEYELDEMNTYVGKKTRRYWVVCAMTRDTRRVVDFKVGCRSRTILSSVTETLLLSRARRIYTDGYSAYRSLIPREMHSTRKYSTNHIERMHLSLRTDMKCFVRRGICFSKSKSLMEARLKIYFWKKKN